MHVKYASRHALYPVPNTVDIFALGDDVRAVFIATRAFLVPPVFGERVIFVAFRAVVLFCCGVAPRAIDVLDAVRALVVVERAVVAALVFLTERMFDAARGIVVVFFCTEIPRTGCLVVIVFCDVATRETEFSSRTAASAKPTLKNSVTRVNIIPFIPYIYRYYFIKICCYKQEK
jgi:hypothetical protein